jgi:predicted DNA-binding transcriptional regulator YafY
MERSIESDSRRSNFRPLRTATLTMLARAIDGGQRASLRYRGAGGAVTEHEVEPDTLGFRDNRWVVAVRQLESEAIRVFLVDRVVSARLVDGRARSSPLAHRASFALADLVERCCEPARLGTIRLRPPLSEVAGALLPGALYEREPGGGVLCHLRVTGDEPIATLVRSLGDSAELVRDVS